MLSERSIEIKKGILTRFFKANDKKIEELEDKDISEFVKDYKFATRDLNIIQLRDFLRWYHKLDKKDKLPDCIKDFELTPARVKRKQTKKERIIEEDDYRKLKDEIKDTLIAIDSVYVDITKDSLRARIRYNLSSRFRR